MKKGLALAVIVSLVAFASMSAFASGISGGSYPAPRDPLADSYARGKSQFKKHITCKKCEFPQGVEDSLTAAEVARKIKAGEFSLNDKQRQDVLIFLEKRYGAAAR
jgi:hypothetical protein